jgi:hypothetical protein
MPITEPYELDGVTVGATAISIVTGTTTPASVTDDGVYQLWVDGVATMTKTEEYEITVREIVEATGATQRLVFRATIKGVQSEVFVTPTLILMHGWDMLIKKLAGTDRAFDASIRKVA